MLKHWQVVLVQSSVGSVLLSSGSWCAQDFVCAPQYWSLFPQSCGSPIIKSCWLSRSDSLGIPSCLVRFPRLGRLTWDSEPSRRGRTYLVLFFSSLSVTHLVSMGFDFVVIVPLLPSHSSFFFVLWCGVSDFIGYQRSVSDSSIAGCNSGALTGGEHMSYYSAILSCRPQLLGLEDPNQI